MMYCHYNNNNSTFIRIYSTMLSTFAFENSLPPLMNYIQTFSIKFDGIWLLLYYIFFLISRVFFIFCVFCHISWSLYYFLFPIFSTQVLKWFTKFNLWDKIDLFLKNIVQGDLLILRVTNDNTILLSRLAIESQIYFCNSFMISESMANVEVLYSNYVIATSLIYIYILKRREKESVHLLDLYSVGKNWAHEWGVLEKNNINQ